MSEVNNFLNASLTGKEDKSSFFQHRMTNSNSNLKQVIKNFKEGDQQALQRKSSAYSSQSKKRAASQQEVPVRTEAQKPADRSPS